LWQRLTLSKQIRPIQASTQKAAIFNKLSSKNTILFTVA